MLLEFKAIGTQWNIEIFDSVSDKEFEKLSSDIKNITTDFENKYSRFKEDSLVSKLNRGEVLEQIPNDLSDMLNLAEKVKTLTNGHFDIGIGSTLESLGYNKDYTFSETKVNANRIDLGGIGKGYLIDKVQKYLISQNIKYFYINAGGDIYATSEFENPITFLLQDPFDINKQIGHIDIINQSIAASSPALRKWKTQNTNKEVHHLIDFKTGESVTDIVGVFTLSDSAINSDLASTALFVSPLDLHQNIAQHLNCEYLIVFKDSSFKKSDNYKGVLN